VVRSELNAECGSPSFITHEDCAEKHAEAWQSGKVQGGTTSDPTPSQPSTSAMIKSVSTLAYILPVLSNYYSWKILITAES
jgi:hypothetical protein